MDSIIDFKQFPNLDVGQRNGATDYIDYLKWDEVKESVMVGVDKFRRKFIVFKMLVNDTIPVMQTFFQRYTDGKSWVGCGHATKHNLLFTEGGMNTDQFRLLNTIASGKRVSLEDNPKVRRQSTIFKVVKLF